MVVSKAVSSVRRLREPFSAASHLFGSLAAVFGAVYLVWICDGTSGAIVTALIYSVASIGLLLVSGLFHGLHCAETTLERLERLDYAAIYLLIASTYTPPCVYAMPRSLGIGVLLGEWTLAFVGMWLALTRGPSSRNVQVGIFLAMGWAFLLALPTLSQTLSPLAFNLLLLGGVFYSIGAVIFACDWPRLFRTRFSAHDCWHVLVLLGGSSHFAFIVQVLPHSA